MPKVSFRGHGPSPREEDSAARRAPRFPSQERADGETGRVLGRASACSQGAGSRSFGGREDGDGEREAPGYHTRQGGSLARPRTLPTGTCQGFLVTLLPILG